MDGITAILSNIKYILLLIIVLLIINFLNPVAASFTRLIDRLAPAPTVEVLSGQTIMSSLRGIGDLITVTSEDHRTIFRVAISQGILNSGAYSADHEAHGVIEAGIDFTRLRSDGLVCGETCVMTVPHPTITRCIITRLRQSDQSLAIGPRDWETLEEIGQFVAIESFIDKVRELRIIEQSKEQTEVLLGELVAGLVGKPVSVVFADHPARLVTGDTCQPTFPDRYLRDEEGDWRRRG